MITVGIDLSVSVPSLGVDDVAEVKHLSGHPVDPEVASVVRRVSKRAPGSRRRGTDTRYLAPTRGHVAPWLLGCSLAPSDLPALLRIRRGRAAVVDSVESSRTI
jgi:hypothetical protein